MFRRDFVQTITAALFPWQAKADDKGKRKSVREKFEKDYPGLIEELFGKTLDK